MDEGEGAETHEVNDRRRKFKRTELYAESPSPKCQVPTPEKENEAALMEAE